MPRRVCRAGDRDTAREHESGGQRDSPARGQGRTGVTAEARAYERAACCQTSTEFGGPNPKPTSKGRRRRRLLCLRECWFLRGPPSRPFGERICMYAVCVWDSGTLSSAWCRVRNLTSLLSTWLRTAMKTEGCCRLRNIGCLLREQPQGRHATPHVPCDRDTARGMIAVGSETAPRGGRRAGEERARMHAHARAKVTSPQAKRTMPRASRALSV